MNNFLIGYILKINDKFVFRKAEYTRKINKKGDKIYSKMLCFPMDYEEIELNTDIIKNNNLILINEPFFVGDEIESKVKRWIEWANNKPNDFDFSIFKEC